MSDHPGTTPQASEAGQGNPTLAASGSALVEWFERFISAHEGLLGEAEALEAVLDMLRQPIVAWRVEGPSGYPAFFDTWEAAKAYAEGLPEALVDALVAAPCDGTGRDPSPTGQLRDDQNDPS